MSEPGGFKRYTLKPEPDVGPRSDRSERLWPTILDADVAALNLEVGGPGDLTALQQHDWRGDFVAGVVDVRSLEVETAAEVADRIRVSCVSCRPTGSA